MNFQKCLRIFFIARTAITFYIPGALLILFYCLIVLTLVQNQEPEENGVSSLKILRRKIWRQGHKNTFSRSPRFSAALDALKDLNRSNSTSVLIGVSHSLLESSLTFRNRCLPRSKASHCEAKTKQFTFAEQKSGEQYSLAEVEVLFGRT